MKLNIVLSVVALLAGCASIASKPLVAFPKSDELARIEKVPLSTPPTPPKELSGDGWQLAGPFPEHAGEEAWIPETATDRAVASNITAGNPSLILSAQLRCAARELGRFSLENGEQPAQGFRDFVTGACGALSEIRSVPISGEAPESTSDAEILARFNASYGNHFTDAGGGMRAAGFWFGRKASRVVLLAVYSNDSAAIAPFAPVPSASNELVLEGEARIPVGYLSGIANKGAIAVQHCVIDPAVKLPRFRVSCPIDPADPLAWVELFATPQGQVLGSSLAEVLVRRDPRALAVYRQDAQIPERRVASAGELNAAILELLNGVRTAHGLKTVKLAANQSAEIDRLAPHYFQDLIEGGGRHEEANLIALGLLAGWKVDGGLVRDGSFFSQITPTLDAGGWLRGALEKPIGRETLLGADTDRVAFAGVAPGAFPALAIVACSYRFARELSPAELATLYSRVVFARSRLKLAPVQRLKGMDEAIAAELKKVRAGEQSPEDALDAAMQAGATDFNASMRGYVAELPSLDALEIPAEILEQPSLQMAAGISLHRPEGAAWAQIVVVIIYVDHSLQNKLASAR